MDDSASAANQTLPNTPPPPAGYGVEYDRHESNTETETEQTSFTASGTVKTADGQQLSFKLELSMSRAYYEESNFSLRLGEAARKIDPLVLNFPAMPRH